MEAKEQGQSESSSFMPINLSVVEDAHEFSSAFAWKLGHLTHGRELSRQAPLIFFDKPQQLTMNSLLDFSTIQGKWVGARGPVKQKVWRLPWLFGYLGLELAERWLDIIFKGQLPELMMHWFSSLRLVSKNSSQAGKNISGSFHFKWNECLRTIFEWSSAIDRGRTKWCCRCHNAPCKLPSLLTVEVILGSDGYI